MEGKEGLLKAMFSKDLNTFNSILNEQKWDINTLEFGDRNILSFAILQSSTPICRSIIKHGFNLNHDFNNLDHTNPWRTCCWANNTVVLKDMLKTGQFKHINHIDDKGRTPLHYAFFYSKYKLKKSFLLKDRPFIKFLLELNDFPFDINIPLADTNQNIYQKIVKDGSVINSKVKYSFLELSSSFMNKGLDINHQDNTGNSLLHYLSKEKENSILYILRNAENQKADFHLVNNEGLSVIDKIKDSETKEKVLAYIAQQEKEILLNLFSEKEEPSVTSKKKRL